MSRVASWRARAVTATLSVPVLVCATAGQGPGARPADLPLTRLEGPGAAAASVQTTHTPPGSQLPSLPLTRLDERPHVDLDGPRTLTLTFSQPLPLREVLTLLVRDTPLSIVPDNSVGGSFAGELKDLTLRQALEAVLFAQELDYDVHGNVIRVFQRKPATRLYELDFLNLHRTWQRRVRAGIDPADRSVATDTTASGGADLLDEVAAGVAALLSESGRSRLDREAGLVQVTDFADRLDQVGVYLDAVRLRATRQVRLQAHVFEIVLKPPATVLDWQAVAARAGTAVARVPPSPTAGMHIADLAALMQAVAEQGEVRVIASPQTLAMNNEAAVMRVGTDDVFFVERGSVPGTASEGLTLTVVPQIAADGIVQLSVSPTYTQKSGQVRGGKGTWVPVLQVSETDSLMRVQEGDTVVVSGLLQARVETKTAGGFGGMFGAQEHYTVHSELVILLTPTVVTAGVAATEESR